MATIAVVGAGNVGQAIAGHMTLLGHEARLYDRWGTDLDTIRAHGGIDLTGEIEGRAHPALLTTDLAQAVAGAAAVVVAAPAFAHSWLSEQLAQVLEPEQVALFQPGVLGSGVELARAFASSGRPPCTIAETPTSLYTCRLRGPATVYVGAVKNEVTLAAVPATATPTAIDVLSGFFGDRYTAGDDVLQVGLENCNPVYHVPPAVLNFKTVENADRRPLHTLVTPRIAEVIEALDRERLELAERLKVGARSFWDFLESAYGVTSGSPVERIVQGYGRQAFPEPDSVDHRYFTEDIPFGLVVWSSLAREVGLHLPVTDSFITLSRPLCGRDFAREGRTARSLGLEGAGAEGIRAAFVDGVVRG